RSRSWKIRLSGNERQLRARAAIRRLRRVVRVHRVVVRALCVEDLEERRGAGAIDIGRSRARGGGRIEQVALDVDQQLPARLEFLVGGRHLAGYVVLACVERALRLRAVRFGARISPWLRLKMGIGALTKSPSRLPRPLMPCWRRY